MLLCPDIMLLAIMSTSVHYKNRHYKTAVLDDFSENGIYIWMKNGYICIYLFFSEKCKQ
jgi:hypothetical protein